MTDYQSQGLNEYLQPISNTDNSGGVSSMDFDANNDRNVIGEAKLRNFSFSKGEGGTIILGGVSNGNGQLTIKDSSGNIVVAGDNLGFHGYLTSGTEAIRINGSGIQGYGLDGNTFAFYDVVGGTQQGQIGYLQAQNAMYLASTNGQSILIDSDFEVQIASVDDTSIIAQQNIGMIAGGFVSIQTGTGAFSVNGTTVVDSGGSKTAIVPTKKGYNALYCMESPEVWFMDFCKGKKVRKWWKFWKFDWRIFPDKMFMEVALQPFIIMPTGINGIVQIWGRRKGMGKVRFESKTKEEFEANNKFWSQNKPD